MVIQNNLGIDTSTVGFIKGDAAFVAGIDREWKKSLGNKTQIHALSGNMADLLPRLFPLTRPSYSKGLFVPTKSPWTMYLNNAFNGTEAGSIMSVLAKMCDCEAMRVLAGEDHPNPIDAGREGSTILETFDRNGKMVRAVCVLNDQGRWHFEMHGTPYDFENPDYYTARKKRDRFNKRIMDEYLRHFGIDAFNPDFYMPPGSAAYMVERPPAKLQQLIWSPSEFR